MSIPSSQRRKHSSAVGSPESEGALGKAAPAAMDRYAQMQEKVISFLSNPASYGLDAPVERQETPQFLFFMAGPYCYKLLRRNALGRNEPFSLAQRHSLAAREVSLGRSYAPELYLDLIPIRERGKTLTMQLPSMERLDLVQDVISHGDESAIVDWVIVLHRYDFSKRYDHFAELYQPNFAECRELARLVPQGQLIDHASQHVISWLMLMNDMFDDLEPVVRKLAQKSKKNTLRACFNRAQDQLDRMKDAIHRRAEKGLFGQIHGNLRLRNVVKLNDGLRMVNPKVNGSKSLMRDHIGDPFYDLATLIGELWSRGFSRQANWVFSHYCNRLFDSHALDGLQVLDLYIFLQALADAKNIKATVNARASTGQSVPSGLLRGGTEESVLQGHVKTARDSLLQDETRLIVINGANQSDRSNLARLLAPMTGRMPGALYLSAEQECLALYEVETIADLPLSATRGSVWELVYRRMTDKARRALGAGYSVILEGNFDEPFHRHLLTDLAEDMGLSSSLVAFNLIKCRQEDMRRREALSAFLPSHMDGDKGYRLSISAGDQAQPTQERKRWPRWIELDATKPVSDQLSLALGHINAALAPTERKTLH
ncbi:hypothetical protein [uncultured Cohaesibacter sp.]|uniref:AAA family ATPase n=1 Tax=uncultured Cohaesibacter sp. TaxID=1002546 RepID=UPI0029C67091|nr:hypothetical protein [uncultured Cohaesibacter sp.]